MNKNDLFTKLNLDAPKPALGEKPAEERAEEPTKSRSAAAFLESLKVEKPNEF